MHAQGLLERLVIPGPVVAGHAKIEFDCVKCHEAYSRKTQSPLCLNCHTQIATDRTGRVGYHGRQNEALKRDCRDCHTEHVGRTASISSLDRDRFDHDLANFRLVDAHRTVQCGSCHPPGSPFRKAATQCVSCHAKTEPHKGRLGDKCANCHNEASWKRTKPFDHSATHFPLEGAHREVTCRTCHAGEVYKDLGQTCVACHRIQDVHAERYGARCETCHSVQNWREVRFDHSATRFPLTGAHSQARCDDCHVGKIYADKLSTTCSACHRKDDPHYGHLGDTCEKCHNDRDWRRGIVFSHEKTRFPLIGEHATTLCESCHVSKAFRGVAVQCESCHQDTAHKGRLGASPQCGSCHNPFNWKTWRFDHARQTRFPLTGAHSSLVCEKCHSAPSPATLKLPMACEACHKDYHQGHLGSQPKCEACHDTVAWPRWRFDHAAQANYPLIGGHLRLNCERCHSTTNAPNLKVASQCVSCHRKDDTHGGRFGVSCDQCHIPIGWRQVKMR